MSTTSKFIVITAILASLLEIIDTSIVNVAIPSMMGNLGSTLEDISWVVTGYIIANAIVLPIAGWLGMQIGRKKYYVGCILLFTATSVACGLAPNLLTLVIFRVLQGLAGGALLPTSQALIQEQFTGARAGMASAIYGMGVIIGPTIGPTLGGYLTDHFGWRSIFNINLPLGLIAAFLAFLYVEDFEAVPVAHAQTSKEILEETVESGAAPTPTPKVNRNKTPVDLVGLVLLAVGIGCFQFFLERGNADDWFDSTAIRITALLALFAIPTFIWWELKTKFPIMNLRMFKHSAVRNGTILMSTLGMMLYSLVFLIPIFATSLMGYSATQVGMLFIPGALMTGFLMPFVGAQLRKRDPRTLIFIGICVVEIFLFMLTNFTAQSGEKNFFIPLIVRGIGMAFLFVPINTVVLGQFRGAELGQVAGMMNLFRQIGGSVGIASLSTLLDRFQAQNTMDLSNRLTALDPNIYLGLQRTQMGIKNQMTNFVGLANPVTAAYRSFAGRLARQSFVMSFNQLMWMLLFFFALAFIPLAMLKIEKKITGPVDAH